MAELLWQRVMENFENFYPLDSNLKPEFQKLGDKNIPLLTMIDSIINIINQLNS